MRADLQHIAAVERAGRLDRGDLEPGRRDRVAHGVELAAPRRGAGATQHREVAEHDHGVFDEDAVGLVVGGIDLDDGPSARAEDVDVRVPLLERQCGIDRHAVEVGQLALGETRRRPANDEARHAVRPRPGSRAAAAPT